MILLVGCDTNRLRKDRALAFEVDLSRANWSLSNLASMLRLKLFTSARSPVALALASRAMAGLQPPLGLRFCRVLPWTASGIPVGDRATGSGRRIGIATKKRG